MKLFQIVDGVCFWDATKKFPTLESTDGMFPPDVLFAEAPDYVFEGWFFNETAQGDARFIQPTPPDGWLYDAETGTFYEDGTNPPPKQYTETQLLAQQITDEELARIELGQRITELELMILGGTVNV